MGAQAEGSGCLYVVGMGLDGWGGLTGPSQSILQTVPVIAGVRSLLSLLPPLTGHQLELPGPVGTWVTLLEEQLQAGDVALLATGDPLFFGIGRLLKQAFPPNQLRFYPHLSSVQLACNRLQIPWQSATIISIHGRSLDPLESALKRHHSPIICLTDRQHSVTVIAQMLKDLRLVTDYKLWLCSRLGGEDEVIQVLDMEGVRDVSVIDPNVVVLERHSQTELILESLPVMGIPDRCFLTFTDRPGLMTKQEVRTLSLGALQLPQTGVMWDVGAGTGSMAIEMGRLVPMGQVYAIEKDAAGLELIHGNVKRFGVGNVTILSGQAPECLADLPAPHRIFLGGGGDRSREIMATCCDRLLPQGRLVANFAAMDRCVEAQAVLRSQGWDVQGLQVNLARSVAFPGGDRLSPLNPVMVLQGQKPGAGE